MSAFLIAAAVAILSVQSAPLASAEPDDVSGTLSPVSGELVSTKSAGKNLIEVYHNVWDISGSLEGQLTAEPRIMYLASGEIIVLEWAIFDGVWNDLEGTMTFRNVGAMVEPGVWHIDSTITRGTGDFAGVYGWGSVDIDTSGPELVAEYSFELFREEED